MPRLQVIPLKQSKLIATLRSAAKRPGFRRMRLASSPKDIPVFLAGIKHCGVARDFDQVQQRACQSSVPSVPGGGLHIRVRRCPIRLW